MPGILTGVWVWEVICTNIRYIKQSLRCKKVLIWINRVFNFERNRLGMIEHACPCEALFTWLWYECCFGQHTFSELSTFPNTFIDLLAVIILSHWFTFSMYRRETNRALYQPSFCMRIRKRLKKSVPHSITDKWVISFIYFHGCVWCIHYYCAPGRHPNENVERFMAVSSQHAMPQLSSADVFSVGCRGRQTL